MRATIEKVVKCPWCGHNRLPDVRCGVCLTLAPEQFKVACFPITDPDRAPVELAEEAREAFAEWVGSMDLRPRPHTIEVRREGDLIEVSARCVERRWLGI